MAKQIRVNMGDFQGALEMAAREFKLAQDAQEKANIRMQNAEEAYNIAVTAFNTNAVAVRQSCKVVPAALK